MTLLTKFRVSYQTTMSADILNSMVVLQIIKYCFIFHRQFKKRFFKRALGCVTHYHES